MQLESPLVSAEQLQALLQEPNLRLLDSTAFLQPHPDRKSGYVPSSGRSQWETEHLQGSQFVDLLTDFSDPQSPLPFTMPAAATFCEKMGALGIGDDAHVVIYSAGSPMWATRLWWMFCSVGFERCAVLDGGLAYWKAQGRTTTETVVRFQPATLTPRPTSTARWATKTDLIQYLKLAGETCVIDALSPKDYSGEHSKYGGKGHIPGSYNVYYHSLLREDGTFLPLPELKALFEPSKALQSGRAICYCGGGIASTLNAFALTLCGHPNVAVYDGSMLEWASDRSLPLSQGNQP